MCNEAVWREQDTLRHVPDNLKTRKCETRQHVTTIRIFFVPTRFKTQEMCGKGVCMDAYNLEFVPGHLKTEEIYKGAVRIKPFLLKYVPDHLKTQDMYNQVVEKKFFDHLIC